MADTLYTSGYSTNGIIVSYAMETTAGTRPTTGYTQLHRINSTGEINPDQEQIDASALEDDTQRNIPGRSGDPGSFEIVVNRTNETITEWETLIAAYWASAAREAGKELWIQVTNPSMTKADFIRCAPPSKIPIPGREQNALETMTMNMTVSSWELQTKATVGGES